MRRNCSMNYKIKIIPPFERAIKRLSKKYKSMNNDYKRLIDELYANPKAGVDLGGGVRKVRMAIASKNRGKSHGARVITFTYTIDEENGIISLLFIYDKEERENISSAEIDMLVAEAKQNNL